MSIKENVLNDFFYVIIYDEMILLFYISSIIHIYIHIYNSKYYYVRIEK